METDIAVIGLSCRFAGDAKNTEEFWTLLSRGKSAFSQTSRFEKSADGESLYGAYYLQEDVYQFDYRFFDISPKEAKAMDPSQRLMLEVAYEAFENAGLPLDAIAGSDTSVHAAQWACDYREMIARCPTEAPTHTVTGTGTTMLSNRLSWFFDLRGASLTINTACSSGMVALHQGCESLRHGDSQMALVAGANLMLCPDMFTYLQMQGFLSPSGKCKTFDASGDGYGRGEGLAALILKPVATAIRDGDTIRAVIRGTGVNQNGRMKSITLPSVLAQKILVEKTYQSAGLPLCETSYVEAHGTGTKVGDPVELEAIANTLGMHRNPAGSSLLVGSVKPNIGHTEACAGLAGVIKSVLMLEKGLIPPNIYFVQPNPKIKFDEWNLSVPIRLENWSHDTPHRISVCSTGYGGTNAHAILDDAYHYLLSKDVKAKNHCTSRPLEQHPTTESPDGPGRHPCGKYLLVVNANDEHGARRQLESLARWCTAKLQESTSDILPDLAFTLNHKRSSLPWKIPIVKSSVDELITEIELLEKLTSVGKRAMMNPELCFVFSGQGSQWAQMGRELYQESKAFRESIDAAETYLHNDLKCTWSVVEEMFRNEATSRIDDHHFSQPLTTILQVGLVDHLKAWDIEPSRIVGHSSGEIAAAYCFGVLSRQDAWKISYHCGAFHSHDEQGAMTAASLSEDDADAFILQHTPGSVVVACINSSNNVTLAGDSHSIRKLEQVLQARKIPTQRLRVDVAYHFSCHMDRVAAEYWSAISDVRPGRSHPGRYMFSTVTGKEVFASEFGPWYWVRNLISPVRFHEAAGKMLLSGSAQSKICVEIGPHHALQGPLKHIFSESGTCHEYCAVLSKGKDADTTARAAAGNLLSLGVPVEISAINKNDVINKLVVDLPPYAWRHDQSLNAIPSMQYPTTAQSSVERESPRICFALDWLPAQLPDSPRVAATRNQPGIVLILPSQPSQVLTKLSQMVALQLQAVGLQVRQVTWPAIRKSTTGQKCVALVDVDNPMFFDISPEDFKCFRALVLESSSLLWLSADSAPGGIVPALARTIRNELPWINLRCLQLSAAYGSQLGNMSKVIAIVAIADCKDNEYREVGGAILVPRVRSDNDMNNCLRNFLPSNQALDQESTHELLPSATYVLTGGLGGLGLSIAKFLASLGARHLCFISRNG